MRKAWRYGWILGLGLLLSGCSGFSFSPAQNPAPEDVVSHKT